MGWADLAKSGPTRKLVGGLVLSAAGVAGIISHEASVPVVYQDVVGINTVCVGHVTQSEVHTRFSDNQCAELLLQDTQIAQSAIKRGVKVPVTQEQYDSLVSLTFNIGNGAFGSSTLLHKLNAGDCHGAAAEFDRWNKAGGKVVRGLSNRRHDERVKFEAGCP